MTRRRMAMIVLRPVRQCMGPPPFPSILLEIDPLPRPRRWGAVPELGDQGFGIRRDDQETEHFGAEEAFGDSMVEEGEQGVEVAGDVEDPERLAVESQR